MYPSALPPYQTQGAPCMRCRLKSRCTSYQHDVCLFLSALRCPLPPLVLTISRTAQRGGGQLGACGRPASRPGTHCSRPLRRSASARRRARPRATGEPSPGCTPGGPGRACRVQVPGDRAHERTGVCRRCPAGHLTGPTAGAESAHGGGSCTARPSAVTRSSWLPTLKAP